MEDIAKQNNAIGLFFLNDIDKPIYAGDGTMDIGKNKVTHNKPIESYRKRERKTAIVCPL